MSPSASIKAAAAAPSASLKRSRSGRSASLPPETVEYLKAWMMSPKHVAHPYPTELEKAQIMAETGIESKQLATWFVNNRRRYWKPRVETRGIAVAAHHVNPRPPRLGPAALTPALRANNAPRNPSTPLYGDQIGPRTAPASPYTLLRANCNLAAGLDVAGRPPMAVEVAAHHERDDPHTISEGSALSKASNSDDDSLDDASRASPRAAGFADALGAAASQYPGSCPSSVNIGTIPTGSVSVPCATRYRRYEEVDLHILRPPPSRTPALTRPDADTLNRPNQSFDPNPAPRKRACARSESPRKGEDEWRRLCQNAKSVLCETLPGLDEAAKMFGYVSPMMYSH